VQAPDSVCRALLSTGESSASMRSRILLPGRLVQDAALDLVAREGQSADAQPQGLAAAGGAGPLGEVEAPEDAAAAAQSPLTAAIRRESTYSPASALALMVFVMIYIPCIATLAVARKELGSFKWPAFMAAYTLVVAYLFAVIVNQAGRWFA